MLPELLYFQEIQKYKHLSYISLQNIPLVQVYTSASGHTEVLETFLQAICENLFSSFVAFLIMSAASQK
jgi:hypothetical protein